MCHARHPYTRGERRSRIHGGSRVHKPAIRTRTDRWGAYAVYRERVARLFLWRDRTGDWRRQKALAAHERTCAVAWAEGLFDRYFSGHMSQGPEAKRSLAAAQDDLGIALAANLAALMRCRRRVESTIQGPEIR